MVSVSADAGPCHGERGFESQRFLVTLQALAQLVAGAPVEVVAPAEEEVPRFQVARRPRGRESPGEADLKRADDGAADLVLNGENVPQRAVVCLRPQVDARSRIDQLRRDPEAVAGAAHAAGEHGGRVQALPRRAHIHVAPLQLRGGLPRRHAQALHLGQPADQLLCQAVAEVFVVGLRAEVGEGQHRDGLAGGGRGGRGTRAARAETGRVAAGGELDNQGVVAARALVILAQLGAQPPRLHAHDGVHPRIVGFLAVEDLYPEQVFLEFAGAALERALHREPQEAAHARGTGETVCRQNFFELPARRPHGPDLRAPAVLACPSASRTPASRIIPVRGWRGQSVAYLTRSRFSSAWVIWLTARSSAPRLASLRGSEESCRWISSCTTVNSMSFSAFS